MLVLAHRGGHEPETTGVRENTLDAFRAALDLGADGIELDVRRAADGRLVVHHDPLLPDGRPVADTPSAALPSWLPSLEDALEACASLRLVNVEIKNSPLDPGFEPAHGLAVDTAAVLALARRRPAAAAPASPGVGPGPGPAAAAPGRPGWTTIVSSFNLATLDAFHAAAPAVATGWLTATGYDQLPAAASAAALGHAAINPPEATITAELVGVAHDVGLCIVAWTVNEPRRMDELAALGVDVIVTDRPALAIATLSP